MNKGDKRDLACVGVVMAALTLVFVILTWNVFWDVLHDAAAYERGPVIIKYMVLRPAESDGRSGVPGSDG